MLDEVNIQQIRELLQQHLRVETVGSQVAEILRQHFGHPVQARAHGFGNLRAMLERYVPELRVVGRSGADLVYRWVDETGSDPPRPGLADTELGAPQSPTLWTTWATPGSGYNVVLRDDRPQSISATDEPEPQGLLLHSTTPAEHRVIAGKFLTAHSEVNPVIRAELGRALELDDEHWWSEWVRALRNERELHSAWVQYRLRELGLLLRQRIADLGLTEARQQTVMAAMMPPRRTRNHDNGRSEAGSRASAGSPPPEVHRLPSNDLRSLVLEAVRRMEIEDLRALRIPVGILADIQAELKS